MPTFFSTVEVDGEIFHGKAGKSKKQAEMKAANVAYAAFMDSKSFALLPLVSITFWLLLSMIYYGPAHTSTNLLSKSYFKRFFPTYKPDLVISIFATLLSEIFRP